jgi:hypothetical protein
MSCETTPILSEVDHWIENIPAPINSPPFGDRTVTFQPAIANPKSKIENQKSQGRLTASNPPSAFRNEYVRNRQSAIRNGKVRIPQSVLGLKTEVS